MTHLAFKVAAKAGGFFSEQIAVVTGGLYSHVELWLNGPQNSAMCYSSREPFGTGFATIDLTDASLWSIVPVALTTIQEVVLGWYCKGSSNRPYDFPGIAGILTDTRQHASYARFCSEECFGALQAVTDWWKGINPWHVAPSGFASAGDRYGLFEMAKLQLIVTAPDTASK